MDEFLRKALEAAAKHYKYILEQIPGDYATAENAAQDMAVDCYMGEQNLDRQGIKTSTILEKWRRLGWWPPPPSKSRFKDRVSFFKSLETRLAENRPWDYSNTNDGPRNKNGKPRHQKMHRFQVLLKEICELNNDPNLDAIYAEAEEGRCSWPEAFKRVSGNPRYGRLCIRPSATNIDNATSYIITSVREEVLTSDEVIHRAIMAWKRIPLEGLPSPYPDRGDQIPQTYLGSEDLANQIHRFYTVGDQKQIIEGLEEYLLGNVKPKVRRSKASQRAEKPPKTCRSRASQDLDFQNRVLAILRGREMLQIEIIRSLGKERDGGVRGRIDKLLLRGVIARDKATKRYRIPDNSSQADPENPRPSKQQPCQESSIEDRIEKLLRERGPLKAQEISRLVGKSTTTLEKYLFLLERTFVISRQRGRYFLNDQRTKAAEESPEEGNSDSLDGISSESRACFEEMAEKKGVSPDELMKRMLAEAGRKR